MNDIQKFKQLIKALYPQLFVTVTIGLTENALTSGVEAYTARLAGPGLDQPVESTCHSTVAVMAELKPAVAKSRRLHDTRQVLSYCVREAGGALTDDDQEEMRRRLVGVYGKDGFEALAATYRKEAQRLGALADQAA